MKIKITNEFLNCLLAFLAAGIIFAEQIHPPIKIFLQILFAVIAAEIIFTWRKSFSVTAKIISLTIFFALGMGRFFAADFLPSDDISRFEGQSVTVFGTIRDAPQKKIFANDRISSRFLVDVEFVNVGGKNLPASGSIILTDSRQPDESFRRGRIGDKIQATGKIKLPTSYKNPGQIDIVTRLKAEGITARMSADKLGVKIEPVDGNFRTEFLRKISNIRQHYRDSMEKIVSDRDAAAIFAMLFGGYDGISENLLEEFQATGIIHILSVSGSHMSLLAAATAYLCLLLKIPRMPTLVLGIFVIVTYTLLSGMLPQVIRSACMGILIFIGTTFHLEFISSRFLTLTALLMLINQPLLLFDISFQLSFSATAGLLYLSPKIQSKLFRLPSFVAYPIAMTLGAQIAGLPIVIWYFNQVSLVSFLANIFVLPILELVIVGGLFGGIIAAIFPFAGKILFVAESIIFGAGAEINRLIASLPFSSIQVPTVGFLAGAIYYAAIIFRRVEVFVLLVIILLTNFFSFGKEVEVNFVDVGQGDCAIVLTPNKKCLIFDTGGVREKVFDIGERVVIPYLKHEGVREVEMIFLTHVHEDHSGGAGSVIKKFPVREIITASEPKSEYAAVFGIGEEFLTNLRQGRRGEKFFVDGVEVEVIHVAETGTGNEISNVYRVRYGAVSFLITGDLVIDLEKKILADGTDVSSTVLKVAHHGSATSSDENFLRAVNPKCAVISVGYGNNFGHPRAEVLDRLNKLGIKIFRTDQDGLIKFKTDGKNLSAEKFIQ